MPACFVLVTPYAERLKVLRVIRSASAERLDMMHMQPDVRTSRFEWLPPTPSWESSRSSALNASVVVPPEDLKAKFLPFGTLLAASSIERVMPLPILAILLSLGQPVLDSSDDA